MNCITCGKKSEARNGDCVQCANETKKKKNRNIFVATGQVHSKPMSMTGLNKEVVKKKKKKAAT